MAQKNDVFHEKGGIWMLNRTCSANVRVVMCIAGAIVGFLCLMAPCLAQDDVPAGDVLLSTFIDQDYQPAVAFNNNPAAKEYLVVWSHMGKIYGQRYTWQGVPQGGNFVINEGTSGAFRPAAAFSLHADSYLVVWEDNRNGNYDIFGQLVDADGSLLEGNFEIYAGAGNQQQPDLAFDGSSYLVVWQGQHLNDSVDICGRFVEDDGEVLLAIFDIGAVGTNLYQTPAVAYNATEGEYLVVFRYGEATDAEIHGRRVDDVGEMWGDEYVIADRPYAYEPDVAAANWGAYVVVWTDFSVPADAYNVYGLVVLAGVDSTFDGDIFDISTAPNSQDNPVIARSPSTGQFLVAWEDERLAEASAVDIYAQRLLADANLAGTNFALSTAVGNQTFPAVASSQEPDIYLVAWEDDRSGVLDVHGQRVGWTGSLLWYDFAISAQPDQQVLPDVAYNAETGEYMAVWEDQDHALVYARRYSADGQPLEEPQVIGLAGAKHQPTVGTDGSFWIVAYKDAVPDAVQYCILYSFGGVVTCHDVEDSSDSSTPRMAYAESANRYLMVWAQGGDIYGGVRAPGSFIEERFVISSGGASKWNPDVAWDPEHQRFLVVWEETSAPNPDIFGRLITADGVFATDKFLIAGGGGSSPRSDPVVTYNPDDNQYLVVYERSTVGDVDVCGHHVTWEGDPDGGEIDVWTGSAGVDQGDPDVVYVPSMQRYYVIWEDDQNLPDNGSDLYGRLLEGDGSPATGTLPFFRYPGNQQDPRLAYDPDRERILVVWSDDRRAQGDVYARLGALDLTPPTARFLHLPLVGESGTTFLFSARPSSDDLTPPGALEVRWDWTSNGSWDTEWSQEKLYTQTVWLPGTYSVTLQVRDLVSHTDSISHPLHVLAPGGKAPQAALTADKNSSVAGADVDLDASGSTDDVVSLSADNEPPLDGLQVRWDWESDGVWDTGFSATLSATHAFTLAGETTVRAEIQDAEGLTDAAFYNITVLPSEPLTLAVWPRAVTMAPKAEARFRATGWDAYGNRMYYPTVAWSVLDADAGAINSSGLFTAGLQAGLYPDVIQAASNGASDTAWVRILYPYRLYLPLAMRID
jgi:hypothetical protein